MSLQNFMGTVWSECLHQEMKKRYVGVANCAHHYTKEIRGKGAQLKVCGLNPVTISDYTPNTDIPAPQELSDFCTTLAITESKYFNFQIDDIEKAQTDANIMKLALDNASNALANEADKLVFQQYRDACMALPYSLVTEMNILEHLIDARSRLFQKGVTNSSDIIIEVTPEIATLIFKAKLNTISDKNELLETGCIGTVLGCKVFVSPNVTQGPDSAGYYYHNCLVRTKRSIAFLDGFSEIVAYRPENRFSEAVKGLYFYGAKVVYPNECIHLALSFE